MRRSPIIDVLRSGRNATLMPTLIRILTEQLVLTVVLDLELILLVSDTSKYVNETPDAGTTNDVNTDTNASTYNLYIIIS